MEISCKTNDRECGCEAHDNASGHSFVFVLILIYETWFVRYKKLYIKLSIAFVFTVSSTTLIVWLILRPTTPQFILQGASTVNTFSLSASNLLSSNLQITLSSSNPNGRIGIYYDKIEIHVSYRGQQITPTTMLPSTYQGHKDMTVWSPNLFADAVPLAPDLAVSLNQERMVGRVLINIKVGVKVRWRVGIFISRTYHLYVNCPAYINFCNQDGSINAVGTIQFMNCHV